ncbi:major facilitator superfamily domain-containing protein [Zychaea mexicana]|uniref:major facilitator superfamily domain-containing protein n=1 Tax=Zychaea mexicana TaxID=64656 RepID=UPI0022FDB6C9|nr:major facilitator superfamily domain-containing protein [Zychaea mexicana]KAI9498526.1 major facilitator superfamily domain-containing protein [Zychaea mexicana]
MDSRQAGVRPFVVFCAMIASLGTFNSGVNTSALNIPSYYVRNCPDSDGVTYYPGSSLPQCIKMDDWIWGVSTGMLACGGLFGALSSGALAERFGRRDSMLMMNICFVIGAVLMSTSTTSAQFAVGRVIVGAASGFMTTIVSVYITEISPPSHRGVLVAFLQLFTTIGIFAIEAIGLGLRSPVGWRVVTVITVAPALIQAIGLLFCARSPRWLVSQNRVDEARVAMLRLRKGAIEDEFAEMSSGVVGSPSSSPSAPPPETTEKDSLADTTVFHEELPKAKQDTHHLSFFQVIRIRKLAILIFQQMVLHAGSQLTGINAIMYYSTSIFEVSFGDNAAYVTVGVAALNIFATIVGQLLIDRLGRKFLMLISSVCMCLFAALMTVGMALDISVLQVVCIMLFVASFGIGLGIVPFLFTAECLPTYAVGAGCSAALMSNWFFNFIVGLVFPTLQSACGDYVFLIFVGLTFFLSLFIFFFTKETKRKTIEEIGRELGWYDLDIHGILSPSSPTEDGNGAAIVENMPAAPTTTELKN